MQNAQLRVKHAPQGVPTPDDFELIETPVPRTAAGQILCRARWLSPDAHALPPRVPAAAVPPARAVAEVIESRNDVFAEGACVELEHGMQLLCVSDGARAHALRPAQNPRSTALGVLGLPGAAAYFGLLDVAQLQPHDIVLVCGAAGAAGSIAGQIAGLRGARAIGLVDAREKAEWVTRSARFAACIDTSSEDVSRRLRSLAPNGASVCFEDGPDTAALERVAAGGHLTASARIVIHRRDAGVAVADGSVSALRVRYVDPVRYEHRREEFLRQAMAWYGEGLLVYREDVVEGLHRAPGLIQRLARGETFGQPLVRV